MIIREPCWPLRGLKAILSAYYDLDIHLGNSEHEMKKMEQEKASPKRHPTKKISEAENLILNAAS